MNRWLNNKYFVLIISIFLATLLSVYVNQQNANSSTNGNVASVTTTKTVESVPIHILDTSNSKYLTGLPEVVTVTLTGPRNILTQLTANTIQVSTNDVGGMAVGEALVSLSVQGLPDGVTATVSPNSVSVVVDKKVSRTATVMPLADPSLVADGYEMGTLVVSPSTVTLTGSETEMKKVTSVTSTAVLTGTINATLTQDNLPVVVKDAFGNILDINVDRTVSMTIPVYRKGQEVPVVITLAGQREGYTYKVTSQSVEKLTLLGTSEQLSNITSISATANVESLTESGTVVATVWVPIGITISNPQEVRVTIEVTPNQ